MQKVMDTLDGFFARQARIVDMDGCTVAIDTNDVEYWGVVDEYVHKKKRAMKNRYVLRYASISIVDTKHKLTLSCMPVRKDDRMEDIVRTLLEKARSMVRVDTVLYDRGFYNATILKTTVELGMDYVITPKEDRWDGQDLAGM